MKSTKFIPLIFAAVLGVACNDIIENAESISFPGKKIVLTAMREGLTPDTKSFRLDDGSVWWSPAEEVSVFYGSGSNGGSKFVSMNTAIAETVELQGSVQMSGSGKDFWAVYPYSEDNSCDGNSVTTVIPDHQTGVEGNFSNDAFPTVAKSSSLSLAFWNICGGIKFFVSRDDIKSVAFKGNNNEALAGIIKVTFGSDGIPVVQEVIDAKTEVTIVAPDGGTFKVGKYYYITLLPAALQNGFTMTFLTADSNGIVTSDNMQTVKRSTFGVLKSIDSRVLRWESTIAEPEWVDFGLPSGLKWATMNVGSTKPEEYGDYFAWGETEPKEDYSWATYKWQYDFGSHFTKYVTDSSLGTVDGKTVLDPEDDAAYVNWGNKWHIPTHEEWQELLENCSVAFRRDYNRSGVNGLEIFSPTENKSIFLPAAGCVYDVSSNGTNNNGYYMSSSLERGSEYSDGAYKYKYRRFWFSHSSWYFEDANRLFGVSIRPVYGEYVPVKTISLDKTSLEMNVKETWQLKATIFPSNSTEKGITWSSSDEYIATISQDGTITAEGQGSTIITAYASNGLSASCSVSVTTDAVPEYVDLGLSVKWATFNVGATKPEEYGDYFAWGETKPHYLAGHSQDSPCISWHRGKTGYNWKSYKWTLYAGLIDVSFKKYQVRQQSSSSDFKYLLDLEDDAANVNWGGNWRIPTNLEWSELLNNCTCTLTTNYNNTGVSGLIVTSKMSGYIGKSIFLPAAGVRSDANITASGVIAYWSSYLTDVSEYAYSFDNDNFESSLLVSQYRRYGGLSVRPVCP